jgi:uncharacterized protein YbgA (DUF1722 family)/uncharacterized protein YbbK (DUF523 family)
VIVAAGAPIRVGISSCLLGHEVRFDGGHKRDRFLTDTLGRFVEWVPVCPEVEAGFGTPREAMRLVTGDGRVRLVTVKSSADLTERMDAYARSRVEQLAEDELCGYVLKKNSPSCGLERVKVYDGRGMPTRSGRGLFAAALQVRCPYLPIEEEARLLDPDIRDNFIGRIFAYQRLRALFGSRWTVGSLVRFHTAHKLTVMAHSPKAYEGLGRLVADAKGMARSDLQARYTREFMTALATMATRRRHTNVLQHIAGYFKTALDAGSKEELRTTIDDYRLGLVPLGVPVTLIRHHVRLHAVSYLAGQMYLNPYPKELMLRSR